MDDDYNYRLKKPRKPRKIPVITNSQYECSEAIHANKSYWSNVFDDLAKGDKDIYAESKSFANVLPRELYTKVCATLDIPFVVTDCEDCSAEIEYQRKRMVKEPMLSFRTSILIDREMDTDTDVEICPSSDDECERKVNVHREFLNKPEREAVTWPTRYLQPEKEDEKSLIKKADDVSTKIAKDFCEYMKELGGTQHSDFFTPKAIKELFQIEFDTHVTQSLRLITKEMPAVEERIALVTGNPDKSQYAALEREVNKDVAAEQQTSKTIAFNRFLPQCDQVRPPNNNTRKLWRSAKNVPKDLVTLKTVWEGITNLRSVKEYCRWMIDHPEHRKPPYLKTLGMFDSNVLDAKLSFETRNQTESPEFSSRKKMESVPIENIRRRLSQLADSN